MPVDMMPEFLQAVSRFIPQYWANQGFQDAMAGTLKMADFMKVSLVLLGIGVAGFVLALLRYPNFLKRARG